MTNLEAFDRLKAYALAGFAEDQDGFIRVEGRGKRNSYIDDLMAEVRAATTIGDVLRVMIRETTASKFQVVDDEPTSTAIPNSEDHERVYTFILRAMGVENLTFEDFHPQVEERGNEAEDSDHPE